MEAREEGERVVAENLTTDVLRIDLAQFAAVHALGENLGEGAAGEFGRAVDSFSVIAVGAPEDSVAGDEVEPFVIGTTRHRLAQRGQPDGIEIHIRQSRGDSTGLAHPREAAVEEDEFGLRIGGEQIDEQHRIRALDARVAGVDLERKIDLCAQAHEMPQDEVLERLSWAETIVRCEVGSDELLDHLRSEISEFPSEFLLFFPVQSMIVLEDDRGNSRELRIEREGDYRVLHDSSGVSRWLVKGRDVAISDPRAVADATHLHARESVPLAWALPLEGKREESGAFWAFLPTRTPTYVPGILNAPWKVSSDRNAIVGGAWNTALMREAARLVADTLATLGTSDDPGRPLEAFPRQLQRKDEEAAPLVDALWEALETADVIPDASGHLRSATELCRPPRENAALARAWQELVKEGEKAKLVHSSCFERQRASRLKALAERLETAESGQGEPAALRILGAAEWFEAIASVDPAEAFEVLKVAEAYRADCKSSEWYATRRSIVIVPTSDGELSEASETVFAPSGVAIPGRAAVDPALCENPEARRILSEVMLVEELDDSVWMSVLSAALCDNHGFRKMSDEEWRSLWTTLRAAPEGPREKFVQESKGRIRIRRRDANWVRPGAALLPGALVDELDDSGNSRLLVDLEEHSGDGFLLAALGVSELPEGVYRQSSYGERAEWFEALGAWLERCRKEYKQAHQNSALWEYLEPEDFSMPRGFDLLPRLRGLPNAVLSERYFCLVGGLEFSKRLDFGHSTQAKYPRTEVPHPLPWWLVQHGSLKIGDAAVAFEPIIARRREPALSSVPELAPLLQEIGRLEDFVPQGAPSPVELREMWLALFDALADPISLSDDSLGELWSGAARDAVVPEFLRTARGEVALSEVLVTSSPDLAGRARSRGHVVLSLEGPVLQLWLENGARNLAGLMKAVWVGDSGPEELLVTVVPELSEVLSDTAPEAVTCIPVKDLRLDIGGLLEPIPCLLWEGSLLLDFHQLAQLPRAERLRCLVNELAGSGWLKGAPGEALHILGDGRVDLQRAAVAGGGTLAERLLRAVGGRREPLLEALGILQALEVVQNCTLIDLADLALAQLGPSTLAALHETLAAEGLRPPSRWGGAEARSFVEKLGFPEEFASSPKSRRSPELLVNGPMSLPPLHDFQVEVFESIQSLVESSSRRRRAVVSLPTGGGKTRVVVEAAVRLFLAPAGPRRSVVWVAQTDELCEQAVQAFRQVWINLGAEATDLRVVRMWGGHPSPAGQAPGRPVAVVTSIQTLNSRMWAGELEWLQSPGLVVVDECHHAITPSYTNLLRWLDAEAPRPGATAKDEPPILGLSATPFRMDDEESRRLAKRFDGMWFPADQEHLHARLRRRGVLADAVYESLETGVPLSSDEVARFSEMREPWDGLEFDNLVEAINQRLAGNSERNERLVNCVQQSREKSILFFCNSVLHAEEMSARLNLAGLAAAAVSGGTPGVARRYFLERFQQGEIRILCNHSVLTTGFDAPKTDMVLIARQVFSPVRYMQMVGRGLRGEANGGTARCRVVTVMDNLGRFQDRHPYHFCRRYFAEATSTAMKLNEGREHPS